MITKLPNSEYKVMKAIWEKGCPIRTREIIKGLDDPGKWKVPTIISLLNRLIRKGFLRSEKNGKEREYFSLITRDDYITFETNHFMTQYHGSSIMNFMSAFTNGNKINEDELNQLLDWAKEYKDGNK